MNFSSCRNYWGGGQFGQFGIDRYVAVPQSIRGGYWKAVIRIPRSSHLDPVIAT